MSGNDIRRFFMKEKKEATYLKLKASVDKLCSQQDFSNKLMEQIQKKARKIFNDCLSKKILTEEEVSEVANKTETYIFSLVEEKLSKLLYDLGEETKLLLKSSIDSERDKGEKNINYLITTRSWISKTDLDRNKEIRNWIGVFLEENYNLN